MTRDEIIKMEAGDELNTLIAQHIFGFKEIGQPKDYDGKYGGMPVLVPPGLSGGYIWPPKGLVNRNFFCRAWSSKIFYAWEVVEMIGAMGKRAEFYDAFNSINGELLWPDLTSAQFSLAICRAALLAVFEEIKKKEGQSK